MAAGARALAFAPLIWPQAVIAAAYGVHLLSAVALLVARSTWRQSSSARMAVLAGLVGGVGLGNHVPLVFLTPMVLATAINRWSSRQAWIAFLAGLAVGARVYGRLPFASATGAPSPWGPLDSFDA